MLPDITATQIDPAKLTPIPFTETVPDVSWYRHKNWTPGHYKKFRHCHTMASNLEGFEFYNEN